MRPGPDVAHHRIEVARAAHGDELAELAELAGADACWNFLHGPVTAKLCVLAMVTGLRA
jgi:hypothetical protein